MREGRLCEMHSRHRARCVACDAYERAYNEASKHAKTAETPDLTLAGQIMAEMLHRALEKPDGDDERLQIISAIDVIRWAQGEPETAIGQLVDGYKKWESKS